MEHANNTLYVFDYVYVTPDLEYRPILKRAPNLEQRYDRAPDLE